MRIDNASIPEIFAERVTDGLRKATLSGMVSNEELLRRFAVALLTVHERSNDPGAKTLRNYGLREFSALLEGEQKEGSFRITYEFCAVRYQDEEGNSHLGLSIGDILRLVGDMESFENFDNLSSSETAISESEVLP